ncbi:Uncharacterised protein [Mycobacterium tuberculosis]|nr:Uncharacterised protein [Mycobacterium tuberculosis]
MTTTITTTTMTTIMRMRINQLSHKRPLKIHWLRNDQEGMSL